MPRRRRFRYRSSPLRSMEVAYELPLRPRSPDPRETDPVQTSDENPDHDQQPRGSSDNDLENDPSSSNAVDIRRDSMFVEAISDSEKSPEPEPTPTIGSPLIVSSDMGREPVESNQQILGNPIFAPIVDILQDVSVYSDESEDPAHIEYAPSSQEPAHENLNIDRIPSPRFIRERGLYDRGFTRIKLGLMVEDIKRPLELREAIKSLHLSKEPLDLRSRRYVSEEEKELEKPIPNDSRAAEYFMELDIFHGFLSLDIDPQPDLDLRMIRLLPRSTPARSMGTTSYKNLDFRKPSRKGACKRKSKRRSEPAKQLLLKYRVVKRCDFKRRRTRKFEAEISRIKLFKLKPKSINFSRYPPKYYLPDDEGNSTRRFNLPKMPGAYPSSSPESLSEGEDFEAVVEGETPWSLTAMEAPQSLHQNGVSKVAPDNDNDAQSDGSSSPRRRPQHIYEGSETTPRPVVRKYPDPSKRIFSVARIQNDTTEDRKARKRRRAEIIRDDGSSDEDWDAQGEPRKILRLHLSEVTKNGKAWEPLTDGKARELMARGRAENYASVVRQQSGHPNGSAGIQTEKEATSPSVRPGITRGQPMNMDEDVDMNAIETQMKTLPQKLSVRDLRELHHRADVICNWNASNNWANSGNITPKAQNMKREMQEIRDKAVSAEPLAKVDDRHRAAILIKYIIDNNVSVNGAGKNNPKEDWAWFHDIEYDCDGEYAAVETELEELAAEIKKLPGGCTRRKEKEERYKKLQVHKECIEVRGEFYDDEELDDEEWVDPCENGKLVPGDSRLNAEYGSAIAKWQNPTTDEDSELQLALQLSKAMFEEDSIQHPVAASLNKGNFVEAMNQGPSHSVALPSTQKWQGSSLNEQAQLEKAIAMSLAESRGENMEQYDDDY
ncbi:predicted protein [Sclerotinia sclerotiorum 1980 UF-70]|uniref:Uncharacterized protein n=1 Tax=Sclerotinia sclerotiorum (strain ATCC 18683 / 1980 / Ss-1) TaxID=665079 RepID=A7EM21_SCLS1|nr:predicted protein [Sclerotinia sclerotiorum 1980 UF-70]EDO03887.1 predicted protein [Sclerotinia sclerotiorum 1980 UF-70]